MSTPADLCRGSYPIALITLLCILSTDCRALAETTTRPHRLIVMADMGNEPDEEQQMAHLLMYANRIEIEGLIACSGKYLHSARKDGRVKVRPDLFYHLIDGYAEVVENLAMHEPGWPSAKRLRSVVKAGTSDYGIDAVERGKSNEASRLIATSIVKDDPRKLYIVGNAGTNTLAQALVDLDRERTDEEMSRLCERIIVFENGAQDNSGAWIANRYPKIAWHRSNHQTYAYGGPGKSNGVKGPYTWEPFERNADGQDAWARKHIRQGHGALGERFPARAMGNKLHFIEGGGTIPWMGLANSGLGDPEHLDWGGWSGRFSSGRHENVYSRHQDIRADEKKYGDFAMFEADSEQEKWVDPVHGDVFEDRCVPVWRFRRAMFNEFRARMDWCVNRYDKANHSPDAVVNGDDSDTILRLTAKPGTKVSLSADGSSDPDDDELRFKWWCYPQAGSRAYGRSLPIDSESAPQIAVNIPVEAGGKEVHIILEVWDRSEIIPMVDYRRVIIDVQHASK